MYAKISGLEINVDKTKAVWIGALKNNQHAICEDLGIKFENKFKLLGVDFSTDLNTIVDTNYASKIEEIKRLFSVWSKRIISPIGKRIVIKTLALSKLNPLIIGLPNSKAETVKYIQSLFLWIGATDKKKCNNK